jgi:hypothetical protein
MLNPSPDLHTDRDAPGLAAAPAGAGRDSGDSPRTRRRHSPLWWLLVAVVIIL